MLKRRPAAPGDAFVPLGRAVFAHQLHLPVFREKDVNGPGIVHRGLFPREDLGGRHGGSVHAVRDPDVVLGDQAHEDKDKGGNHEHGGGVHQPVKRPERPGFELLRPPQVEDQRGDLQHRQRQVGQMQDVQPHLGDEKHRVRKQGQQGHGDQPDPGEPFLDGHVPLLLSRLSCSSSCRRALKESNWDSMATSSSSRAISVRYWAAFFHRTARGKPICPLAAKSSR